MPNYDRNRFILNSDKELDEFTCGICHAIFTKPVVTDCCQQTYCSDCIKRWLENNNTCPNCRKTQNGFRLPPKAFVNLMGNLKITCDYQSDGCDSIIKFDNLVHHIESCEYRPNTLCKLCSKVRESVSKHNCIETLLNENKKIKAENLKLNLKIKTLENQRIADMKSFDQSLAKIRSIDENGIKELENHLEFLKVIKSQTITNLKKTLRMQISKASTTDSMGEIFGSANSEIDQYKCLFNTFMDSADEEQIKIALARSNINNRVYSFTGVKDLVDIFDEMCKQAVLSNDSFESMKKYIEEAIASNDSLRSFTWHISFIICDMNFEKFDFVFIMTMALLRIRIMREKSS